MKIIFWCILPNSDFAKISHKSVVNFFDVSLIFKSEIFRKIMLFCFCIRNNFSFAFHPHRNHGNLIFRTHTYTFTNRENYCFHMEVRTSLCLNAPGVGLFVAHYIYYFRVKRKKNVCFQLINNNWTVDALISVSKL